MYDQLTFETDQAVCEAILRQQIRSESNQERSRYSATQ